MNRRFASKETIAALTDHDDQTVTDRTSICNRLKMFFFSVFEPPTSREDIRRAKNSLIRRSHDDPCFSISEVVTPCKVQAKLMKLCSTNVINLKKEESSFQVC
ncbi:hypothetical protein BpHYR1_046751 [Brachionus plicatilis]|uniref:Uncharacterized protein n=1 Tax=Brachionus plicatilis TaxID=10195 RepID=A0A3M7QU84_BRAPC|nr:hypothetical protein BpHYR1_046751 [Brachionus plicatilis]